MEEKGMSSIPPVPAAASTSAELAARHSGSASQFAGAHRAPLPVLSALATFMRPLVLVVLTLPALLVAGPGASAQTDVCGTITDTHWTLAGSPYVVSCNATLSSGTLVIDPGVTARFQPGTRLDVTATLSAQGTAAKPVIFTSWPWESTIFAPSVRR